MVSDQEWDRLDCSTEYDKLKVNDQEDAEKWLPNCFHHAVQLVG